MPSGWADRIRRLVLDVRLVAHDHVELLVLEAQRASQVLVRTIAAAVVVSVLVATAWLGIVVALVVWLAETVPLPVALLIGAGRLPRGRRWNRMVGDEAPAGNDVQPRRCASCARPRTPKTKRDDNAKDAEPMSKLSSRRASRPHRRRSSGASSVGARGCSRMRANRPSAASQTATKVVPVAAALGAGLVALYLTRRRSTPPTVQRVSRASTPIHPGGGFDGRNSSASSDRPSASEPARKLRAFWHGFRRARQRRRY